MSNAKPFENDPKRSSIPLAQAAPRTVPEHDLARHTRIDRTLAAANQDLRRQISGRDRLDRERHVAERESQDARGNFGSAFTRPPIGMALVDLTGRWLEVNDALCRILGYRRQELEATTLRAIAHPEDVDSDERSFENLLGGKIPSYQVEKRFRHAFGHPVWVLVTFSLVRDERGEPLHIVSQVEDISERKELAPRLEQRVDRDLLTGLYNRRRFRQEVSLQAERMARYGARAAVLVVDLDNFKSVNDALGHKAGDDLLRSVAGALRHRMRRTDVVARVGGDEFAVLLPDTDADHAQVVAEGIRKTLGRYAAVVGERAIPITASVGVALFDGLGAVEGLEFADLALYEAKEAGRNRVSVHRVDGGRLGQASQRSEVELIRTALDENRMLLYCQPILDLKTKEVGSYELLLRLRTDATTEPLSPGSFLYVAERFDLIQEIDCWVARRAIALIAEHGRAGRRLTLHVNLSAKSIGEPRVAALIEASISSAGIDPASLVLEMTETAAVTHFEAARTFAHRLRVRGCRFALDDFGGGFGSFHYLKSLPVDFFKIDGDLVRGIAASPLDRLVVEAIAGIARGTGKKTIAEFVPDEDTSRLLGMSGVDYAQGYHVGRPRPLGEVFPTG